MNKNFKKNSFIQTIFFCSIMMVLCFAFPFERSFAEDRPFVFYTGASSPMKEILEARLKEAFYRIGEKSELIATGSAQRSLLMANEQGDGDASRIAKIKNISPDMTTNLLQVPESIITIAFYVYTKGKSFQINGWESLADYHNGFRVGAKILEKNIPGRTTILPDSIRLMKMLDQERLDTVTEHDMIGDRIVRKLKLSGIQKLEPALVEVPGYCFVHKKNKHLISKMAKALADMKTDETFKSIEDNILKGAF